MFESLKPKCNRGGAETRRQTRRKPFSMFFSAFFLRGSAPPRLHFRQTHRAHRGAPRRTATSQGAPTGRFGQTKPPRAVSRGQANPQPQFESHRALPTWQRFLSGCRNGIQRSSRAVFACCSTLALTCTYVESNVGNPWHILCQYTPHRFSLR